MNILTKSHYRVYKYRSRQFELHNIQSDLQLAKRYATHSKVNVKCTAIYEVSVLDPFVDLFKGVAAFRLHERERGVPVGSLRWLNIGHILLTEILDQPVSQQPSRVPQPLPSTSVHEHSWEPLEQNFAFQVARGGREVDMLSGVDK